MTLLSEIIDKTTKLTEQEWDKMVGYGTIPEERKYEPQKSTETSDEVDK
jgi:hypothetical protein